MEKEINIYVVFAIMAIHWIADFIAQSDDMAKGKSKDFFVLLAHTAFYSIIFWLGISIVFLFDKGSHSTSWVKNVSFCFALITFVCHTATDYYTSRVNSQLYEAKNIHGFFVSIGFDQLLHYFQLILTYQYLMSVK